MRCGAVAYDARSPAVTIDRVRMICSSGVFALGEGCMASDDQNPVGSIAWHDLTVPDAGAVRDFYEAVIGWEHEDVDMGDYADYAMKAPGGDVVGGVCHARGVNDDWPSLWLMYVMVEDLDASLQRCKELGGAAITPVRGQSEDGKTQGGSFCVIKDPAGAVLGLMQK